MQLAVQLAEQLEVKIAERSSYAPSEHSGSSAKEQQDEKISCPPCCTQGILLSCLGVLLANQREEFRFRLFHPQLPRLSARKLVGMAKPLQLA